MIDEQMNRILTEIYFMIRHKSAWLADCKDAHFTDEELNFLEKLADGWDRYQPEKDAERWADEVRKSGGHKIFFAETDEEKLRICFRDLTILSSLIPIRPDNFYEMECFSREFKEKESLIKKIRARQIHKEQPFNHVTEHEISIAREYPLSRLLGGVKRIPCPWHRGKDNNFLVKEFGYCFVCGEWSDSIKWLMIQERYDFKGAVKRLQ